MTRQEFAEYCKQKIRYVDGATGTNLQKVGLPVGVCPEAWILENPDSILNLQAAYAKAGTNIVYAPTFTANRIKLEEYGLQDNLESMNAKLVELSKKAVGASALVAGDITMTGKQLFPLGDLPFEELVDVYKEQIKVIADAGADLLVVETMMSLQECRAAVIAAHEICDLPVMVTLTFNDDGRTLYGTDPQTAAIVLDAMGVDAIGVNCSSGPMQMVPIVEKMACRTSLPIIAKPNAGMPELVDGKTVYAMTPEEFATAGTKLVAAGATILGGCCGTTPEHIKALVEATNDMPFANREVKSKRVLTSERKFVDIILGGTFNVVGERINPTGKKKLQEELRAGRLDMVRDFARSQEENGAAILDVNMGTNGIDEKQMMLDAVAEVSSIVDCPLCIDSSHVDVIEAALRNYPGRAIINSISNEAGRCDALMPLAKKYGAMFVLLPLDDEGIPETIEKKHQIIDDIIAKAKEYGLTMEDIVVDGLVATVGANPMAARECYATIEHCSKDLNLPTICGLSNISFGMPNRQFVNTAFLVTAISKGLSMAIANPSQDLLMNLAFATDLLEAKEDGASRYLERMEKVGDVKLTTSSNTAGQEAVASNDDPIKSDPVYQCVLKGNKSAIVDELKKKVADGMAPGDIINTYLVPAIGEVGNLYDQKKYFLPQLIGGANAMQEGMTYLEPMLASGEAEKGETIVFATVEGDIHDIGKNLVVLMLKNYGYDVHDLGKDVPADVIVAKAKELDAKVIGLSALMTTTMMRMKEVVDLARKENCTAKIIVGGAAITPSFADEIGADGYSTDAADCVKLVQKLLG